MKIRFIRLPFLIPTWASGQVIFPRTILYTEGAWTHSFLAHEIRHVFQIEEMGLLKYWWYYIKKLTRFGYHEHPLEDDARDAAWDPVYRDYAEQCLVQIYENGIPKGNVHEVTLRLA